MGQGCFCQLINADRNLYRSLTQQGVNMHAPTHFIKNPYNALQTLDTYFPLPSVWTLPAKGSDGDSPSELLSWNVPYTDHWTLSTANDTFETWSMYKPPPVGTQRTTWIPMARYTWAWKGTATWNAQYGRWDLTNIIPSGKISEPVAYSVHPAWNLWTPPGFGFIGVP